MRELPAMTNDELISFSSCMGLPPGAKVKLPTMPSGLPGSKMGSLPNGGFIKILMKIR